MAYVIGIDTGGTYTDTVLLDPSKHCPESIVRKAKAFTTHGQLSQGIREGILGLHLNSSELLDIERVVLSTTLATNAIVEKNISKVGLLLLGDTPKGQLATDVFEQIPGRLNIKGRILVNTDKEKTLDALKRMLERVDAIAVSGAASVRNPLLEQNIKETVKAYCKLPVMCGHEFASELGFLERTNTAVINAGLLPIINSFIEAIKEVLAELKIIAPVFVVKADGSISTMEAIREKPVDTVLSGPAASMTGAVYLSGMENAIISDMGGTTTDTGIVRNRRVELSKEGAEVGGFKIRIKSAKLYTFGLGGDSGIKQEDGRFKIGPRRVLPACRGGDSSITPTDLLHYTEEFVKWDRRLAIEAIEQLAKAEGRSGAEYVKAAEEAVCDKIYNENISLFRRLDLPVCAIGAPAKAWYYKAKGKYGFDLVVPENYEVANAVGAAIAGIREEVVAVVRPGEEGHGFLAHTEGGRFFRKNKQEAVEKAIQVSKAYVKELITRQNLTIDQITVACQEVRSTKGTLVFCDLGTDGAWQDEAEKTEERYIETRIKVSAGGKIFSEANSGNRTMKY